MKDTRERLTEGDIMRLLQIKASALGARLFRQNTGLAWVGKVIRIAREQSVRVSPGDVVIRNARPFHAGFEGMSDLGGWVPVEITPDMVGQKIALYAQVEVKKNTRATAEQMAWIQAVNAAGGRAGVAHDDNELASILFGKKAE